MQRRQTRFRSTTAANIILHQNRHHAVVSQLQCGSQRCITILRKTKNSKRSSWTQEHLTSSSITWQLQVKQCEIIAQQEASIYIIYIARRILQTDRRWWYRQHYPNSRSATLYPTPLISFYHSVCHSVTEHVEISTLWANNWGYEQTCILWAQLRCSAITCWCT